MTIKELCPSQGCFPPLGEKAIATAIADSRPTRELHHHITPFSEAPIILLCRLEFMLINESTSIDISPKHNGRSMYFSWKHKATGPLA
jgi:hypothetical protein